MKLSEQLERIHRLHLLIKKRGTGTPDELSKRLGISRRQLFRIIDFFKNDIKAPIDYSKTHKTYFYFDSGEITEIKWISSTNIDKLKSNKNGIANHSNK